MFSQGFVVSKEFAFFSWVSLFFNGFSFQRFLFLQMVLAKSKVQKVFFFSEKKFSKGFCNGWFFPKFFKKLFFHKGFFQKNIFVFHKFFFQKVIFSKVFFPEFFFFFFFFQRFFFSKKKKFFTSFF